jgi:hypothetical protein
MIALMPGGLAQHTRYYFAIFAGVIVGLMLEPIPGAAIGLIAITLVTVLCEWVFFPRQNLPSVFLDSSVLRIRFAKVCPRRSVIAARPASVSS